jgi:hypothetical protein
MCSKTGYKHALLAVFFFLLFPSWTLAQKMDIQQIRISGEFKDKSLLFVLTNLVKDYHLPISFDPEIIPAKTIQLQFHNAHLTSILDTLFLNLPLEYILSNQEIIIRQIKPSFLTLSGHIRDSESGDDLIGAEIELEDSPIRVLSNNYGYYVLSVPYKDGYLLIRHLGYITKRVPFFRNHLGDQDIVLSRSQEILKEVHIKIDSNRSPAGYSVLHGNALSLNLFRKLPFYGGERDIIKALQMQNGIVGLSEGGGSLFFRGGNRDQNLILLDEATVYNPGHLFGLVSIFNPDAVKNIQVYDDRIPANYGGRLSSVIDARTTDGNHEEYHVRGGISLLSARLALEGPIFTNKITNNGNSFFLAFRYGLLDGLNNTLQLLNIRASFYDVNLKLNFRINPNNQIFFSGYNGIDNLISANKNKNIWGNQTATFRWNHLFNSRLFFNLSGIYSNYQNLLDLNSLDSLSNPKWKTSIRDFSLKGDFTFYYKTNNQFKFGFNQINHLFVPGELQTIPSAFNIPREQASENDLYVQQISNLFGPTQISYGIRASLFQNHTGIVNLVNSIGGNLSQSVSNTLSLSHTYFNLEPRVDFSFKPNAHSQLHLSFDRTVQYLQILENDELAFSSLETWFPANAQLKPQIADMESLGYQSSNENFQIQVDVYDKQLSRQLDLLDHTQIILNPEIGSRLRSGNSQAYGLEISLQKISGKWIGNLGYTYARVFRKITDINNNQTYPANYDIPHSVKLTLSYHFNPRISLTSFFLYSTGRPITLPVGFYYQENLRVPIYNGRNTSRFPDMSRLDINLTLEPKRIKDHGHDFRSTWTFGIYNVYNRKNPLYFGVNQNATVNSLGYLHYFSGIAPNLSYSFRF